MKPKCDKRDCHGCDKNGFCTVLIERIKGKPCPFYKSKERLAAEITALQSKDFKAFHDAAAIDGRA